MDGAAEWQAGWHVPARRIDSPNFGARPAGACIDLVVVHSISLPPGQYGGPQIEQLFTNTLDWEAHPYFQQIRGVQVSAHFLIRRDGELLQFVSCDARSWHAGHSRFGERENCNDFSIGVELEGLEGEHFEAAQYEVLARLLQALKQRYPIEHVAGHEHVAPQRKHDPGAGFDWSRLAGITQWPARCFPLPHQVHDGAGIASRPPAPSA